MRSIVIIARFVVLEALRGGLPWLAFACIAASVGLAAFLAQVALTETREFQAAGAAALLRAPSLGERSLVTASSTLVAITARRSAKGVRPRAKV